MNNSIERNISSRLRTSTILATVSISGKNRLFFPEAGAEVGTEAGISVGRESLDLFGHNRQKDWLEEEEGKKATGSWTGAAARAVSRARVVAGL